MASVVIDIGHGHIAVSYWSVTLNGLYMPSLNTKPDNGEYAVIDPNGRAFMDEDGERPYLFTDLQDAKERVEAVLGVDTNGRKYEIGRDHLSTIVGGETIGDTLTKLRLLRPARGTSGLAMMSAARLKLISLLQ